MWRYNEGGGSWNPLFARPFNDWELDEVCRFFVALSRKRIQQAVDDRVIWRDTKCGKFSVKSLYKSLVLLRERERKEKNLIFIHLISTYN